MEWMKRLRRKKIQSGIILLIILVCALLMSGSWSMLISLNTPYEELKKETNSPQMRIEPQYANSTKDWFTVLESLESVEQVVETPKYNMTEKVKSNGKELGVFIGILEYTGELHENIRMLEGERELEKYECIIPSALANEENLRIGERIEFLIGEQEYIYTIKGIAVEPYSLWIAFQMEIIVGELPELSEKAAGHTFYSVYIEDKRTVGDVQEEYLEKNNGILDIRVTTIEESISNATLVNNILGGILLVLSTVICLVISVVIKYMVRNTIIQDRKDIAMYKAMGYTDGKVKNMYLSTYLAITLVGSLFGVLLSPILSNVINQESYKSLGITNAGINILSGILCILIINANLCLQILWELRKIAKVKPAEVFNAEEHNFKVKKISKKHRKIGEFTPFAMALRMLQRSRKDSVILIITCFLSIYMVNMVVVSIFNIDNMQTMNYYWLGFDEHDIYINNTSDLEEFLKICQEIAELEEVEKVVKINIEVPFTIEKNVNVNGTVYESYTGLNMPILKGRNPIYSNEIVMGNYNAKKMNKEVGDYINVQLDENTVKSMLLVGTYQSFFNMGKGIRILSSALEEERIEAPFNSLSVYIKEGTDRAKLIEKITETYGENIKAGPREEKYGNILAAISEPQKAALGPFALLVIFIGCLNIIYIIYLKNIQNKKTYAIYKSIGYDTSHLMKMNLTYMGILAVISAISAIPTFLITFPKMMILSLSFFGFEEYPVTYDPKILCITNVALIGIFLISTYLSSRNLQKNNIKELVQE